jgi:hypothetical protein
MTTRCQSSHALLKFVMDSDRIHQPRSELTEKLPRTEAFHATWQRINASKVRGARMLVGHPLRESSPYPALASNPTCPRESDF